MQQKLFIIALILCMGGSMMAQQDLLNTQFYFNRLIFNPGYAGLAGDYQLVMSHRSQWIGLEGAPNSQMASFDMSIAQDRVGIGASLLRASLGVESRVDLNTAYSYKIPLGSGTMGLGLQLSMRNFSIDYADQRLTGTQNLANDSAISGVRESKWLPNVGVGLHYQSESFFFGVSSPRILENNTDFSSDVTIESRYVRQIYLMAGAAFVLNNIQVQPMSLMRITENSPYNFDLGLLFTFKDQFTLGGTYRISNGFSGSGSDSVDALAAIKLKSDWLLGVSYDFTLSQLRSQQNGSLEVVVRYIMSKKDDSDVINPRFF